jgi:glycosyltransferase involved in cell wall biosynthesis
MQREKFMEEKRIIIIPDLYRGLSSGAIVTQVFVHHLKKLGWKIAVYSREFTKQEVDSNGILCMPAKAFSGFSNIVNGRIRKDFVNVLDLFKPTHLLFDGSITNKPLCLLEEGLHRNLHIDVFIFMQDFFCSKLYANNEVEPCTKCLSTFYHAYTCPLIPKDINYFKLPIRHMTRWKLSKLLPKVNHVITSTDEQISFYEKFGIPRNRTYKMPLPFIMNKNIPSNNHRGNYIIGIAQNRVEKGFQLLPEIMKFTHNTKLVLAYYNDDAVQQAMIKPGMKDLIDSGKVHLVAASWKTNLSYWVANAAGVVIPSIWPTTTEYGLQEALAFGKPIVCFDISVHKEQIQEGIHGYKAPIKDFKTFAAKMDKLSTASNEEYEVMQNGVAQLYHDMTDPDIIDHHLRNILE